jgi:NADH-quinone oxidoreductase subunit J
MVSNIIFFILAFVAVVSSIMAVTSQKIIRSAVFLLFVLLSTAGFYFLLDYHFLAITQIAVYAGGVMVLFIFSIVLTSHPGADVRFEKPGRMLVAALAALTGLAICGHIIFYNVNRVYYYSRYWFWPSRHRQISEHVAFRGREFAVAGLHHRRSNDC